MEVKTNRLHFIDAMRAWAILMMLQGHFVDGLLDPVFRDPGNAVYSVWLYFRGITAPVFFTVSGFIFTYLLIRVPQTGWDNPRIQKGFRRGIQLLLIGYLLRLNPFGLLEGKLYDAFYQVDVLHCIGISILIIIGIYLLTAQLKKWALPLTLLSVTLLLFLFEPLYSSLTYTGVPEILANYFTRNNGSVFTIIPWAGYTSFGAFLAVLFRKFHTHQNIYPNAIWLSLITGVSLVYFSSPFFSALYEISGVSLFNKIVSNNYLFIRLGNVMVVFAIFMILRQWLVNKTLLKLGQSTLSIYLIHFVILYGSFTGLGLYRFFDHSLAPATVIPGAVLFMIACSFIALEYDKHEAYVKGQVAVLTRGAKSVSLRMYYLSSEYLILLQDKILRLLNVSKG